MVAPIVSLPPSKRLRMTDEDEDLDEEDVTFDAHDEEEEEVDEVIDLDSEEEKDQQHKKPRQSLGLSSLLTPDDENDDSDLPPRMNRDTFLMWIERAKASGHDPRALLTTLLDEFDTSMISPDLWWSIVDALSRSIASALLRVRSKLPTVNTMEVSAQTLVD